MAWNAELLKKIEDQDKLHLHVRFFDDASTRDFTQWYTVDSTVSTDWLKRQARRKIDALNAKDALDATEGPIDTSPPPDTSPPQAELDFADDLFILQGADIGISLGVIDPAEHPEIDTLRDNIKTNFNSFTSAQQRELIRRYFNRR